MFQGHLELKHNMAAENRNDLKLFDLYPYILM